MTARAGNVFERDRISVEDLDECFVIACGVFCSDFEGQLRKAFEGSYVAAAESICARSGMFPPTVVAAEHAYT